MNQDIINRREKIRLLVNEIVEFSRSKDPKHIAKAYNIKIFYRELGQIKGFSRNDNENKFIAINSSLSNFETKIVLAHELGHLFLHKEEFILEIKDNFYSSINKYEYEANYFAAYLLFSNYEQEYVLEMIENENDEKIIKNFLFILSENLDF